MKEYTYTVTCTTYKTEVVTVKAESENGADDMLQEMIDTDDINFDNYTNSDVYFNYDIIDIKYVA